MWPAAQGRLRQRRGGVRWSENRILSLASLAEDMTEVVIISLACSLLPTADPAWRKLNGFGFYRPPDRCQTSYRFSLDKSHNGSYITVMVEAKTGGHELWRHRVYRRILYRQENFDDLDTTALLYFSCSLQESTCLLCDLLSSPVCCGPSLFAGRRR